MLDGDWASIAGVKAAEIISENASTNSFFLRKDAKA